MKNLLNLTFIIITILFISCDSQNPKESNLKTQKNTTDNYKKTVFEKDERIEKIKSAQQEIAQKIEEHKNLKNIPGVAYGIVVDDSLIISNAFGFSNLDKKNPTSTKSSFRIASLTKSFTAMAILKLRDEGKLKLDDSAIQYIPELKNLNYLTTDSPEISIENLLTMTAGLPEDNPWGDRQLDMKESEFLDLIKNGLSLSKVSSQEYEYSNTGYALLGLIITRISGQPYQNYITENILIPLDMKNTYWEYSEVPQDNLVQGYGWENEKWVKKELLHDGIYGAMGGLITTIEDFSKYASFHLAAWPARNGEENTILKRSSLREMHTPKYNFLNSWNRDWNNEKCASMIGYGYGLGISMDCKRIKKISHNGSLPGFGSNFTFYPDYGIGIMSFGNVTYNSPFPQKEVEKILFEKLNIQPRKKMTSDFLKQKKEALLDLLNKNKISLNSDIFAENFFLDKSRNQREQEYQNVFDKAGSIKAIEKIFPRNQLRGDFVIECENGKILVFFTLTPENSPKIQKLTLTFYPKKK
ncbi:serine hydrolase domain-containing protein [Aureivirga sp. CE67]|uniref:serine hydrolase domain-containing protein n=1 Tax=Aureivirga sp. CE67 TaxID=1788983 RepID=UPI0018C95727|nr:serine hydrolase domain-containing protein [Aureivirga sp. CE67]